MCEKYPKTLNKILWLGWAFALTIGAGILINSVAHLIKVLH